MTEMELILLLLVFAVLLALTVGKVGLEVYAGLFTFTTFASVTFLFLYFRLFM